MMNKSSFFAKEVEYIKNPSIRRDTITLIDMLPDYFFTCAASSTGKYHPKFSLGEGGLLRHTKAAVQIMIDLYQNEIFCHGLSNDEKDLLIMALILHDGLKHGIDNERYVRFDHPVIMADFIEKNKSMLSLSEKYLKIVTDSIRCHMGPWITNPYSEVILPIPKTKYEKMVHLCDYLSSRKGLNFEFDEDNNITNTDNY